jgi:hypothetical protein
MAAWQTHVPIDFARCGQKLPGQDRSVTLLDGILEKTSLSGRKEGRGGLSSRISRYGSSGEHADQLDPITRALTIPKSDWHLPLRKPMDR